MLVHHFNVAFRNLWKYKSQNFISIIGLTIGFACFTFSSLWVRYEMNYDLLDGMEGSQQKLGGGHEKRVIRV
jgi:hypothetical protein